MPSEKSKKNARTSLADNSMYDGIMYFRPTYGAYFRLFLFIHIAVLSSKDET